MSSAPTLMAIGPAEPPALPCILRLRHDGFSVHAPRACTAQEVQNLLDDVDPAELEP